MDKKGFKSLIIGLVFALVFTSLNTGALVAKDQMVLATNGFKDLQGREWFRKNAERLLNDERQIIQGYPDGEFKGQNTLSVEQFITMVDRALELNVRSAMEGEHWSKPYIESAVSAGVIAETDFNDYQKGISRAEMSSIIINAVEVLDGEKAEALSGVNSLIKDLNNIKYEYQDSVKKVYSLGIITGYNDGTFGGDKILNRAEAATVVVRMIDKTERVDVQAAIDVAQGDMSAYMYGGSLWVNPLESDWEEIIEMQETLVGGSGVDGVGSLNYTPATKYGDVYVGDRHAVQGRLSIGFGYSLDFGTDKTTVEEIEENLGKTELLLGTRLTEKETKIVMDYLRKRDTSASLDGHTMQKKKITDATEAKNYYETFYFEEYVLRVREGYQNRIPGVVEVSGSTGVTMVLEPRNAGRIGPEIGALSDDIFDFRQTEEIIYSTEYVNK